MKIGNLAGRTGTSVPTIRYYEEIGLLQRADRETGDQRRYSDGDVKRLTFIRQCRALGCVVLQDLSSKPVEGAAQSSCAACS